MMNQHITNSSLRAGNFLLTRVEILIVDFSSPNFQCARGFGLCNMACLLAYYSSQYPQATAQINDDTFKVHTIFCHIQESAFYTIHDVHQNFGGCSGTLE